MRDDDPAVTGAPKGEFESLARRLLLTYRYNGLRSVLMRGASFPLRFTPARRWLPARRGALLERARAARWYAVHGRPVAVVPWRASVAEVNRALARADARYDVWVGEPAGRLAPGSLAALQHATAQGAAVVGPKLLTADGRIASAGVALTADGAVDRYRGRPRDWGPADVALPTLGTASGAMYLTREAIDRLGTLDEALAPAEAQFDYCLRAWRSGLRVAYAPGAELVMPARWTAAPLMPAAVGPRPVRTDSGALRVIYVAEGTQVGGGNRDIFEHVNGLAARGHEAELWTLGPRPDWFDLQAPVRTFGGYDELTAALGPVPAIKVATWWKTATPVWLASVDHGLPLYFVQDIETSYYPDAERARHAVLASYREEFRYVTISSWNVARLGELGLEAELIPPGVDLDTFRPLEGVEREAARLLAVGRANPLKNLPLTLAAWRALPEPRPELCLFGNEPSVGGGSVRYVDSPTDAEVNELLNESTVFVQTSTHEGFCLPLLEAMAAGCPVVCTDADGNRDFCQDGVNCLMPAADPGSVAGAIRRVLSDPALTARLRAAGLQTAAQYAWEGRLDALEQHLRGVADSVTVPDPCPPAPPR